MEGLLRTETPKMREIKLNPPKPFSGKRSELRRFLQDCEVYLFINKELYDNDDKKVAFVLLFMNGGDAEAWKEELVGEIMKKAWKTYVTCVRRMLERK